MRRRLAALFARDYTRVTPNRIAVVSAEEGYRLVAEARVRNRRG